MKDINLNYRDIIASNEGGAIEDIYWGVDIALQGLGIDDLNLSKLEFINCLRYLEGNRLASIEFKDFVLNKEYLDTLPLEFKLGYIYGILPVEYSDKLPEKDIDNLWWHIYCPLEIKWRTNNL